MMSKSTLCIAFSFFLFSNVFSQITLTTAVSNNSSGGIFLRLTTNTNPVNIQQFNTYFSSANGTAVNVEVYTRSGDYTGFTTSNAGWTLISTVSTTSAGTTGLAPVNVSINIPSASVRSIYLHAITAGGGIRYTGTTAIPPTTTFSDANLELYSTVARTGAVAFAGTANTPRTFAGSVVYSIEALPVKWINISGKNVNNQAQLSWKVEENKVKSYSVEKQVDNGFSTVISVNSKGDGQNVYSSTDATSFENNRATAIYRIKQIDKDGRVSYSPVVVIKKAADKTTVSVYPNPFMSSIQIHSATKQMASVASISGKIITTLQLSSGTNAIDAQNWLPGIYMLKTETGEAIKIVKQ